MSRAHLVSLDTPELVVKESTPNCLEILQIWRARHRKVGHIRRKGLVQPKITPPFHGYQISKPHVPKLVQIGDRESEPSGKSIGLSLEQICFIVCNAAHVLHSPISMFRNKDLIIFSKWVLPTEEILIKLDAHFGDLEHLFMLDVLLQAFPCINSHWWVPFFNRFIIIKWSSHKRKQIRRDLRRLLEGVKPRLLHPTPCLLRPKELGNLSQLLAKRLILLLLHIIIGNSDPITRHSHLHFPPGSDIRLIKDWEQPVAAIWAEIGVYVLGVVAHVDKGMQTHSITAILAPYFDGNAICP